MLYAPLGAACTAELHAGLRAAVAAGPWGAGYLLMYALRPVLPAGCQQVWGVLAEWVCVLVTRERVGGAQVKDCALPLTPLPSLTPPFQVGICGRLGSEGRLVLPGFGVEAVLKNMEYSAMDDKNAKKGGGGGGADEDGGGTTVSGTVKGFDFGVLGSRRPGLLPELASLKDHLMTSDEEETVKVRGGEGGRAASGGEGGKEETVQRRRRGSGVIVMRQARGHEGDWQGGDGRMVQSGTPVVAHIGFIQLSRPLP